MADIIFRYPDMEKAAVKVVECSGAYLAAAQRFEGAIKTATDGWEGDSKDKFIAFIEGSVHKYTHEVVPEAVTHLATVLRGNITAMGQTDTDIAAKIPK